MKPATGVPSAVDLLDHAHDGGQAMVVTAAGQLTPLLVEQWGSARPGDESVVSRCAGPTLDIGCGVGRITHALAAAGVAAVGIDISRRAIELARARGVMALQRNVFGRIPAAGRWDHVLLIDGNIGIAGEPRILLRRCRELLAIGGTAIVEVMEPGHGLTRHRLRLACHGLTSRSFSWCTAGIDAIEEPAEEAGFSVARRWSSSGRWFVELAA